MGDPGEIHPGKMKAQKIAQLVMGSKDQATAWEVSELPSQGQKSARRLQGDWTSSHTGRRQADLGHQWQPRPTCFSQWRQAVWDGEFYFRLRARGPGVHKNGNPAGTPWFWLEVAS